MKIETLLRTRLKRIHVTAEEIDVLCHPDTALGNETLWAGPMTSQGGHEYYLRLQLPDGVDYFSRVTAAEIYAIVPGVHHRFMNEYFIVEPRHHKDVMEGEELLSSIIVVKTKNHVA